MARHFIPEDRTIIGLDTNVIRDLCYGEPPWLAVFQEMAKLSFDFCITDVALGELTDQFERGSIKPQDWETAMARVSSFISSRLPILPGGHYLRGMADVLEPGETFDPEETYEHSWAAWELFSRSKTIDDLKAGIVVEGTNRKFKMSVLTDKAPAALQDERDAWIRHTLAYDPLPKDVLAQHRAQLLPGMQDSLDKHATSTVPMSTRLDMALRHKQRQLERRNSSHEPYNPESAKKRNDGIDFTIDFTLMLPALVCTSDGGYLNALTGIDSFQRAWVYRPQELADAFKSGKNLRPEWPR